MKIQTILQKARVSSTGNRDNTQDNDLRPGNEVTATPTNFAVDAIGFLHGLEVTTKQIEICILHRGEKTVCFSSKLFRNYPINGYVQKDAGELIITAVQTATPVDLPLYQVFKQLRSQFRAQGYRPTPAEWVRLGIQCRAEGTNNAA